MIPDDEAPQDGADPLAGVLGRLLARERGGREASAARPTREGAATRVPAATAAPSRRAIVVAGTGADGGEAALRWAAQWATLLGRRAAVADLFCGPGGAEDGPPSPRVAAASSLAAVPRARVPCALERLRREPGGTVAALLERLRRHEASADLLLVRVPAREASLLLRAALLAGAVVLPVDASPGGLAEALHVSREIEANLVDVRLWPWAGSPRTLAAYLEATGGPHAEPFDPAVLDLGTLLEKLPAVPEEGFLTAALAPAPASLPDDLLRLDDWKP